MPWRAAWTRPADTLGKRWTSRAARARAGTRRPPATSSARSPDTEPSESEQALENYRAALILAEELGMAPLQALCHLRLGGVHQRMGQDEEAKALLGHAVAMLQAMQMRHWLP